MRRKTKIVLAITFMVAALVLGFSYIYISELLRQRVTTARESAAQLTSNLAYLAANAAPDLSSTKVDTSNPEATRRAVAYYLGTDRDLNNFLESVVGTWPIIYDTAIVDSDGKVIIPPPEKGQAGVDFLKIADDKHTAGWLVDEKIDDGTSYPIALTLVVYRSGKILHRFGDGMVIANWCFLEGGEQVAFYTNTLHGDLAPHYELHGVASGRLVGKYDGHPGPHAPAWTRDLADQ